MRAGIFNFGANATRKAPKAGKKTGNQVKHDKRALSQGAHIILQCCREAGLDVVDLCQGWQPVDIIMCSLYWWEHLYDMVAFLASKGIQYDRKKRGKKPILFVGGQLVSYNPAPVKEIADYVCIGDGEEAAPRAIEALMGGGSPEDVPGIYSSETDNCAEWQHVEDISGTLRWPFVNHARKMASSGIVTESSWERRIEIARGCKRKCLFCGVSWTKKYRENDGEAIASEILATGGAVKSFAPDPMAHSGWSAISAAYEATGRCNQAKDISAKMILERGFHSSRAYITGIEGLSERLRRGVCKPLSGEKLQEILLKANRHMGSLEIYLILDLPTEQRGDYQQWFTDLSAASAQMKPEREISKKDRSRGYSAERFYAVVTLNAFCPTPHTPMQWAGINWQAPLKERYFEHIDILGPQDERHLKHKMLCRPHGPLSRMLESAALRAGPQIAPFIFTMARKRKSLVGAKGTTSALLTAKKLGLDDHLLWTMSEKRVDEELPWANRVRPLFDQNSLAKAWNAYRSRVHA